MEPDDLVVYNSNIAYHVRGDDVQQQYNSTTTDHNAVKTPTKATNSARASKVLSILTVILVLLILILMALSVVTITQLNSTIQRQLNKADNGDVATVLTQLVITCNNISQKLFQFDTKINNLISLQLQNTDMEQQANCGPGLWYQVAHLNMSDPSQKCPSVWRDYNRVRACGRPFAATGSCATKRYLISNQYSRVCGRVIGYQFRSPDAFHQFANTQINFDGINITTGAQHSHIWSYVAGHTQEHQSNCPCASQSAVSPPQPYVGDHYYCDSGEITNMLSNDPLWDGQHCENNCCTGPPAINSSPPWFSVQLPVPTTDTIEVSICCDQGTGDEDIPIEILEIYVQ